MSRLQQMIEQKRARAQLARAREARTSAAAHWTLYLQFHNIKRTLGLSTASLVAFVVGMVVAAAVTIALQIYQIVSDAAIPHTLIDNLNKAKNATPNLASEISSNAGFQTMFTTFIEHTMPDVDYGCTNGPVKIPPCFNGPAPAAVNTSADPQFIVVENHAGTLSPHVGPSIYSTSSLDKDTGLESRLSGNGWFVTTSYDLIKPGNLAAPTTPSVATG